ncbi:MAG: BTAD domain-containing putative transcriptional regulator [Gemmatimonadales bacterium]|nr:BTAD domain-containing putative transcriptional regulator [Gemmatimonadales bacterium]
MLRINTFGGLWVELDGRRVEGSGPRRNALLALLAVGGARGVSRDRLLLYLWPDATDERARHSLSQTVYSINRQLGEVIAARGTEVRLDAAVSSDVGELLAAHQAGDAAGVVRLYQGPFLDGFALSDAAEFEDWSSGERRRLELIACEAMEGLAAADPTGPEAAALWRRLAAMDPLATRYAIALARATARAGDPGAAIKQLRLHQQFLRAETGAPPPAELTLLLAELAAVPVAPVPVAPVSAAAAPAAPAPAAPPTARPNRSRLVLIAAALLLVVGAAAVARFRTGGAKPLTGGAMVVLADVDNRTADSTLGPALTVAASVALQQSAGFSVYARARLSESLRRLGRSISDTILAETLAQEIAQREGGQAVIALSVAPLGDRVMLAGRILEPATGATLAARRESVDSTGDVLEGLDRLMGWVRRELGDADWRAAAPLPLVTTPSLSALRAFAEAGFAFGRGDYPGSRTALERALAADTGFAMAQVRLGSFFIFTNDVRQGLHWLREAEARKARLTVPEQLEVALSLAVAEGRTADALATSASLATRFPSAPRWYAFGEALRAADRDPDAIEAYGRAVALDSNYATAHQSIAIAKRKAGDVRGAIDAYDRAWRADSSLLLRQFYNQQWGAVFIDVKDYNRAEAVFRKMLTPAPEQRARGYRSLAYLSLHRGRYREAIDRLDSAIALYRQPSLSLYRDLTLRADAASSRGDFRSANAAIDRAMAIFRQQDLEAPFLTFVGRQLIRADRLGEARLVLDSLRVRAALRPDRLQDQAGLAVLGADLALATGRPAEALDLLHGKSLGESFGPAGRLIMIDALLEVDRRDSAFALAREMVERIPFGVEGMQDAFRMFGRLARVAEAVGDSATARQAYSSLLSYWEDGDRDLPLIVEARRELARLQRAAGR